MAVEVRNDTEQSRYEVLVDDTVAGFADYELGDGTVELPHTVVDPGHRGQGLAERLVVAALTDARAAGRRVIPTCSYVADYVRRHPEHQDLLAGP